MQLICSESVAQWFRSSTLPPSLNFSSFLSFFYSLCNIFHHFSCEQIKCNSETVWKCMSLSIFKPYRVSLLLGVGFSFVPASNTYCFQHDIVQTRCVLAEPSANHWQWLTLQYAVTWKCLYVSHPPRGNLTGWTFPNVTIRRQSSWDVLLPVPVAACSPTPCSVI